MVLVEISDIKDRDSLKVWLESQPQEVSVAIAQRAAIRVMFNYWHSLLTSDERTDVSPIFFLRPNLIAGVASARKTMDIPRSIEKAAKSADLAATPFARFDPIAPATYGSATVDAAASSLDTSEAANAIEGWEYVRKDCVAFSRGRRIYHLKLWHDQPNPVAKRWQQTKDLLQRDPVDWSFWIKWVEAALAGKPLNAEMLYEIALIEPDDWEQGAEHVNEIIAGIEGRYKDTPLDPIPSDAGNDTSVTVDHLLQQRVLTEMVADGLADQIQQAIEQYTTDSGQNQLPEAFQKLEGLPPVFKSIAMLATSSKENEALLEEMRAEIYRLRILVTGLEYDLHLAKNNSVKNAFTKSFIDQAGKSLGDWKMYAALAGGTMLFVGGPVQAETLNSLSGCIKSIFTK